MTKFGKNLSVTADVDRLGKYVEFNKSSNKIRLYEDEWDTLCNNVQTVSQNLLFNTSYELKFTPVKGLTVMQLKCSNIVILYHLLMFGGSEIIFDAQDWDGFLCLIESIKKEMSKDVVYKDHDNSWHLIKEATSSVSRQYALLSRMEDVDIVRWLYAYLLCREVEKDYITYVGSQCIHKKEKYCESCWTHIVQTAFHIIKEKVSLENTIKILNSKMNWNVKLPEMNKVESHAYYYLKDFKSSWDECDCIEGLQGSIYLRLFAYLKL